MVASVFADFLWRPLIGAAAISAIGTAMPLLLWRLDGRRWLRARAWGLPYDPCQELLHIAGRTAKLGGWVVHLPDRKVEWSDETRLIHGIDTDRTPDFAQCLGYFSPEWRDAVAAAFEACALDGKPYDIEVELVSAQGQRKWVRAMGAAVRSETGRIVRVQGAFQDIDERKALEAATRQLELKFSETIECISDGFIHLDGDWRFTYLNRVAERCLGRTRESLLGKVIWQAIPETAAGAVFEHLHRAMDRQEKLTFEACCPERAKAFSITVNPSPAGLTIYFRDVTGEREAEQQLRLLEMAVSTTRDFVIITETTASGRQIIRYVNDAFVEITGYSPDEAIGRPPGLLQGPKTDRTVVDTINAAVREGRPVLAELVNYTKDGREYWSAMSIAPILGPTGKPSHFVATGRDVSEQRRAGAALAESEERLAIVAKLTTDAVWDWDTSSNSVRWNSNITALFGHEAVFPEEELDQWSARIHADDRALVLADIAKALSGTGDEWQMEYRFQRADGSYANVLDRGHILRNETGAAVRMVGGIRDITVSKAQEARHLQRQRLEAVGQLTGGVAHDFNNLLTVITGTADTLVDELAHEPRLLKIAQLNRRASERGAALTRQLLTFAGRQPLEPRVIDLNSLIAGMDGILAHAVSGAVVLRIEAGSGLWRVRADVAQLESSILNLCLNARDAMVQPGQITLRTMNVEVSAADHFHAAPPGQYVCLGVTDNGRGMDDQTLAQVFDPFFTTKGVGRGSGLGLSMVYGFVQQSGGYIDVVSEPDRGTTVSLFLPRVRAALGEEDVRAEGAVCRGGERILVVEDDPMVKGFTEAFLKSLGYDVVSVASAEEGLALLRDGGRVDLIIADFVKPGASNGCDIAARVRRSHPDLPILFTSGLPAEGRDKVSPRDHFIVKPYTGRQVAEKIRQILD